MNIYYTAGFPQLNDTMTILEALAEGGTDLVEIGMPYSDPVADGPTIQESNDQALENGMSLKLLFKQLEGMRKKVQVPVLLMGYVNPVIQYGVKNFVKKCREIGVDGVILPDLPIGEYLDEFRPIFEENNLLNIFLITPQTPEARIRQIDSVSKGFIYMVSSASVTGNTKGIQAVQEEYFARIKAMNLQNPTLIGFGISDHDSFSKACQYANGAIIGSAFIKQLQSSQDLVTDVKDFVSSVKGKK